MNLTYYIRERLKGKEILLMTHIVIGYPDLEISKMIVDAMVRAGVDIIELQIPFTEPIADGPVILKANHMALKNGTTVEDSITFAGEMAKSHPIPFVVMSYYNTVFKYGLKRFSNKLYENNIKGAIIADLPPEEAREYLQYMRMNNLCTIFLFSPTTSTPRMKFIASHSTGFIYCVARKGVTGKRTCFSLSFNEYIKRCRMATELPLAVGFGIQGKEDIEFLKQRAEVAVIGTRLIRIMDENMDGITGITEFIESLRE